tara:strand:- start:42 stop:320 length:279 start_codon:yes stop_codon:yes gene_type:complete
MNFTKKFLQNQKQHLDKYVHFTMFSFINLFVFCLIKDKALAYFICLSIALGFELVQKIKGGKNTPKEMAADAFASQFTALMFLAHASVISYQ